MARRWNVTWFVYVSENLWHGLQTEFLSKSLAVTWKNVLVEGKATAGHVQLETCLHHGGGGRARSVVAASRRRVVTGWDVSRKSMAQWKDRVSVT